MRLAPLTSHLVKSRRLSMYHFVLHTIQGYSSYSMLKPFRNTLKLLELPATEPNRLGSNVKKTVDLLEGRSRSSLLHQYMISTKQSSQVHAIPRRSIFSLFRAARIYLSLASTHESIPVRLRNANSSSLNHGYHWFR